MGVGKRTHRGGVGVGWVEKKITECSGTFYSEMSDVPKKLVLATFSFMCT